MTLKKGLMTQFPFARGRSFVCKNIGDYVQAVATRQYVNNIDEYVEQEEADTYQSRDGRKIRLIMNGWFQWRAENWPPSDDIKPLLVSMHISPLRAKQLLSEKGIAFLKRYSPVGCRDYYTKKLLESVGVPAYFSACMTLTLGKKYKVTNEIRDKVYLVDPYFEIPPIVEVKEERKILHIRNLVKGFCNIIRYAPQVISLGKREFFRIYSPTGFLDRSKNLFRPYYKAAMFYATYRKKFDGKLLLSAEYITHWMDVDMSGKVTNDDLLDEAECLVKKYAAAKMVITSRIHAGLPCLGMHTPVVFIANKEVISENGSFNTPGRLGGLLDLFRVLTIKEGNFFTDDVKLSSCKVISKEFVFENKNDWEKYAKELDRLATEFMSD